MSTDAEVLGVSELGDGSGTTVAQGIGQGNNSSNPVAGEGDHPGSTPQPPEDPKERVARAIESMFFQKSDEESEDGRTREHVAVEIKDDHHRQEKSWFVHHLPESIEDFRDFLKMDLVILTGRKGIGRLSFARHYAFAAAADGIRKTEDRSASVYIVPGNLSFREAIQCVWNTDPRGIFLFEGNYDTLLESESAAVQIDNRRPEKAALIFVYGKDRSNLSGGLIDKHLEISLAQPAFEIIRKQARLYAAGVRAERLDDLQKRLIADHIDLQSYTASELQAAARAWVNAEFDVLAFIRALDRGPEGFARSILALADQADARAYLGILALYRRTGCRSVYFEALRRDLANRLGEPKLGWTPSIDLRESIKADEQTRYESQRGLHVPYRVRICGDWPLAERIVDALFQDNRDALLRFFLEASEMPQSEVWTDLVPEIARLCAQDSDALESMRSALELRGRRLAYASLIAALPWGGLAQAALERELRYLDGKADPERALWALAALGLGLADIDPARVFRHLFVEGAVPVAFLEEFSWLLFLNPDRTGELAGRLCRFTKDLFIRSHQEGVGVALGALHLFRSFFMALEPVSGVPRFSALDALPQEFAKDLILVARNCADPSYSRLSPYHRLEFFEILLTWLQRLQGNAYLRNIAGLVVTMLGEWSNERGETALESFRTYVAREDPRRLTALDELHRDRNDFLRHLRAL